MASTSKPSTSAYALLTITAVFWAGNAVAGKFAVGHVSPFMLTTLRWTLACLILLPFSFRHLRKDAAEIRAHLPFLVFLGLCGFAVFNNFLYLALNHTTAINAAIIQAAMPLVVFGLNFLLFRDRATRFQIVGFSLTLIGVMLTATRGSPFALAANTLNYGDVLMLFAVLAYGIYSVFLSKKPDIHLLSFIFVLACASLAGSLFFSASEAMMGNLVLPDVRGWAVVVYTAVFPSLVSQLFWVMGIERIGSNRGGVFINLVPIFAAMLAVFLLGEQLELYHVAAIFLVLGGVTLAQRTSV